MHKFILWISLIFLSANLKADVPSGTSQLESYFEQSKTPYLVKLRFYTYLYAAQNDAATYPPPVQLAIAQRLIQRFFPDINASEMDVESAELADDILCPYLARLSLEETGTRTFASKCWLKQIPDYVSQVANWIPWTSPLSQPPPPPSANDRKEWAHQFNQLKTIRRNLTQEQRDIMKVWVGHHGKEYGWRTMANRYMEEHAVPYETVLFVRAVLMKGLYDGLIAEYEAKYTFCVPRPFMMDPSFKSLIPELQSPSYPSGHAIQGSIFAGILSYFFPEDLPYWQHLNEEGANTRLWAGVHFPQDIVQGQILGERIAEQTLEQTLLAADFMKPQSSFKIERETLPGVRR